LTVTFDPSAVGIVNSSLTIASNVASDAITLTGTGAAVPVTYSALLNWDADSSPTSGYNIYGSNTSGGPYTKLNPASVVPTSYTDSSVQAGQTYYFVVTAVNANNMESGYSNQVSALIP